MIFLLIQGALGQANTLFDVIGAWWSKMECIQLLYSSATSLQSFEAMLHKSLLAISFLKATKSRDLSFLKLMCLTVASTFLTLRQHKTEQWSERKLSGEGVPLMILSELQLIIRSKICPITCVGDFTCWVRHNDSNRSANAMVSASSLTSRWTLKSPYMQIGTLDSTNDSRYSLNSGKKVLEVIGWAAEYGGLYTITSLSCKDKPSIIYSENSKEVFHRWTVNVCWDSVYIKVQYHPLYDQYEDNGTISTHWEWSLYRLQHYSGLTMFQ